ncbi:hypothetical protein L3i23_04030 [Herbiconiux sp. L3-i23]|nr:hypothetical protein L3i23_04030 [Herbiconiux sp. L3-i23]
MIGPAIGFGDALLWARTVERSGEVDADFVAAQLGRASMSVGAASRAYAFGAFRRGVSVRPDFDEVFARAHLPEGARVPAFYSYLRNRSSGARPLLIRPADIPSISRDAALAAARQWAVGTGALGGDAEGDDPDRSTVVLIARGGDARLGYRIRSAADAGDRVVIIAHGVESSEWTLIAASANDPRVSARLAAASEDLETAVGQQLPRTGRYLVVDPRAAPTPAQMGELLAAARPGRITVPIERASDDTVASVGAGTVAGQVISIFAGLPVEDVERLGSQPFRVPSRAGWSFAVQAGATQPTEVWVDPTVRFRNGVDFSDRTQPRRSVVGDDREAIEALYQRAGYSVDAWGPKAPVLRRVTAERRWAVKVASLAGPEGDVWGDTHFGDALAAALRRLGHDAVVDRREAAARASASLDDVHVIVRGPTRIRPPRGGIRVLWIISHPHQITAAEIDDFDLIFAASASWAASATQRFGRPVAPLFECTDATLYRPHGLSRGSDILFVGKSRDVPRRVVMAPIEAGIDVKVYGPDWASYIPTSSVVAPFVPVSALPAMYEQAGVVLNDQWAEMREAGFPAMRPFDVVAAGGRVISEDVEGLTELLGPGVITYRDEAELVALLEETSLDRLFPSDAVLRENAERVRRDHSFDARAADIERAVAQYESNAVRDERG